MGDMGGIYDMVVSIDEVLSWIFDLGGKSALGGMGKPSLSGVDVHLPLYVPGQPCLQRGVPVLQDTAVPCIAHLGLLGEHPAA